MTELTIMQLPAAPLFALEIWSHPADVAARFIQNMGVSLPAMGGSARFSGLTMMRFEPTVWLVEGDIDGLSAVLGDDGGLTAIGGGITRVRLSGPGWRRLLMEGGVFDAQSDAFAVGCCAATVIDHVNVRLFVESDQACTAFVPASYGQDLIHFWEAAIGNPL